MLCWSNKQLAETKLHHCKSNPKHQDTTKIMASIQFHFSCFQAPSANIAPSTVATSAGKCSQRIAMVAKLEDESRGGLFE